MMIKIECECGHTGVASAKRLPRTFTCSQCGTSRSVERGRTERIISRERRIENVLADAR